MRRHRGSPIIGALLAVLAVALACVLVLVGPGTAAAQDVGTDPLASTTTTAAEPGADAGTNANQTLVQGAPVESRPLWTESRKIVAIIGGLVFVALALTVLTIRYWRMTKPIPVDAEPSAALAAIAAAEAQPTLVASMEHPVVPPAADHAAADADWEPKTGEHTRIEPGRAVLIRPSLAVRRAALGLDAGR